MSGFEALPGDWIKTKHKALRKLWMCLHLLKKSLTENVVKIKRFYEHS